MSSGTSPATDNLKEVQATRHLELNELEETLTRFGTPHIATITFFKGKPPIDLLYSRLEATVAKNPWLGGRLVRIAGAPKGIAIEVGSSSSDAKPLFKVFSEDIGLRDVSVAEYSMLLAKLEANPELMLKPPAEAIDR